MWTPWSTTPAPEPPDLGSRNARNHSHSFLMNRFLTLLAVLLVGCATNSLDQRMASVREGMTEGELTSLLGKPRTITNQGALRTFDYVLTNHGTITSYYVIIGQDGLVRSF